LIFAKEDKLLTLKDLKENFDKLWNPIGNWRLIPLGKEYYEFCFSSQEDLRSVWSIGAWSLHLGTLAVDAGF